jgi:DNA-binding MarR family transcriptional regulator
MQATLYQGLVDLLWAIRRQAPIGEMDRTQLHLLALLSRQPGLRSTEVSRIVGLDLSTVSRHCSDLVARGLLARDEDPEDRRATRLSPTDEGRLLIGEIVSRQQAVLEAVLSDWSDTDRELLTTYIARLGKDLNARQELENAS